MEDTRRDVFDLLNNLNSVKAARNLINTTLHYEYADAANANLAWRRWQ